MSDVPPDPEVAILDRAVDNLREHFENIHIFATRLREDGQTMFISRGGGNWFARYGQIKEWCIRQEEQARCDIREDNKEC